MGHLFVLLLLLPQQDSLISRGRKKAVRMLEAVWLQLYPFLLLRGCGGEQGGVRGPLA